MAILNELLDDECLLLGMTGSFQKDSRQVHSERANLEAVFELKLISID